MDVFSRYAPFVQEFIYRSGWQSLRGVQNAAGDANSVIVVLRFVDCLNNLFKSGAL